MRMRCIAIDFKRSDGASAARMQAALQAVTRRDVDVVLCVNRVSVLLVCRGHPHEGVAAPAFSNSEAPLGGVWTKIYYCFLVVNAKNETFPVVLTVLFR